MKFWSLLFMIFFLSSSLKAQQSKVTAPSFKKISKKIKLDVTYPVIMEGFNSPGVIDRSNLYKCGSIAFVDPDPKNGVKSDDDLLYYVFKAWNTSNGKCNFQNTKDVKIIDRNRCPAMAYKNKRYFSSKEVKDSKLGARALELQSQDGELYVLSSCFNPLGFPQDTPSDDLKYIGLGTSVIGTASRDHAFMKILEMKFDKRSFDQMAATQTQNEVLSIQIINGWRYIVILDPMAD